MKALFNIDSLFFWCFTCFLPVAILILCLRFLEYPTRPEVTSVKRLDLIKQISIPGTVEPEKKIIITAPYDGYVQKLYVKTGDHIKANTPIVSVTETLQSYDPVYPLRIPFSGTVTDVLKREGDFVRQNDTENYLVRIDQMDQLYVEFDVPELYRPDIVEGREILIKVHSLPHKTYKGVVDRVALAAKQQSQWRNTTIVEFRSRALILDKDKEIKPGLSAVIDLVKFKKEKILVLPHSYIFKKGDAYFVLLKNGRKKQVQVGDQNDIYMEIKEGLEEGTQVRQILQQSENANTTLTVRGSPHWHLSVADTFPNKFQFFDWQKELLPLKSLFPAIEGISPYLRGWETSVHFAGQLIAKDVRLMGVSEDGLSLMQRKLFVGAGINAQHIEQRDSVCVIGFQVWEQLFTDTEVIGQMLSVSQQTYNTFSCRVIGVLERAMAPYDGAKPNLQIFIPFTVFQMFNEYQDTYIWTFMVQVKREKDVRPVALGLKNVFEAKYGVSGFFEVDFNDSLLY